MSSPANAEILREAFALACFIGGACYMASLATPGSHDLALLMIGAAAGYAGAHNRRTESRTHSTLTPPPPP